MGKANKITKCSICMVEGVTARTHCSKCSKHHSAKTPCLPASLMAPMTDHFESMGQISSALDSSIAVESSHEEIASKPASVIDVKPERKQTKCKHCSKVGKSSATHCHRCGLHHPKKQACSSQLTIIQSPSGMLVASSSSIIKNSSWRNEQSSKDAPSAATINAPTGSKNVATPSNHSKKRDLVFPDLERCVLIDDEINNSSTSAAKNDHVGVRMTKRFAFCSHSNLLLPFPKERVGERRATSKCFASAGNINNFHMVNSRGDGNCFSIALLL